MGCLLRSRGPGKSRSGPGFLSRGYGTYPLRGGTGLLPCQLPPVGTQVRMCANQVIRECGALLGDEALQHGRRFLATRSTPRLGDALAFRRERDHLAATVIGRGRYGHKPFLLSASSMRETPAGSSSHSIQRGRGRTRPFSSRYESSLGCPVPRPMLAMNGCMSCRCAWLVR